MDEHATEQHAPARAAQDVPDAPVWVPPPRGSGLRAPPFPKGMSGNPGGKPKGASPRAAALRALAANPDADGIGEVAGQLGEGLVKAAQKLTSLVAQERIDPDAVKAVQGALAGLVTWLDSIEPNVRKSESTQTVQRVVFSDAPPRVVEAEQAGGGARGVAQVGAGPIQDAPLPSLGATQQDPLPPASKPSLGPPATDPHPAPPDSPGS